jgi:uncharacterized membrane protein YciS (DUF1049 family)
MFNGDFRFALPRRGRLVCYAVCLVIKSLGGNTSRAGQFCRLLATVQFRLSVCYLIYLLTGGVMIASVV